MLHRFIAGKRTPTQIIIPNEGIHECESTQTLAIDHPALATLVEFVNTHFHTNICVTQIMAASGQSRLWLEDAFRRELNCSPPEFLKRRRVTVAVRLLRQHSRCDPGALAAKCGFSGARQLNAAFEGEMGMNVKQYAKTETE